MMPFNWEIHNHPNDYWRFTPEALHVLLEEYPTRIIGWQGPDAEPLSVWAIAQREHASMIDPEQFNHLKKALGQHAKEPLALAAATSLSRLRHDRSPQALCSSVGTGKLAHGVDCQ